MSPPFSSTLRVEAYGFAPFSELRAADNPANIQAHESSRGWQGKGRRIVRKDGDPNGNVNCGFTENHHLAVRTTTTYSHAFNSLMANGSRSSVILAVVVLLLHPWTVLGQMAVSTPKTSPPPAWVDWNAPVAKTTARAEHESSGQIVTLIDTQINAAKAETFVRVVKEITTQAGVQSGANLEFTWDPSFQELILHQITILRDAKQMSRLDLSKFKIIQQETDLHRQIYNGALSALLFIEDVRPGDRIEYAYTLRGENPSLKNKYSNTVILGGSVPIRQRRIRLLWPKERVLFFRSHVMSVQPEVRTGDNTKEYIWDLREVPAVVVEDQAPSWVSSYPWLQLSEFASWSEVATWAAGLYVSANTDSPELKEHIAKLRRTGASAEETVESAMKFAQNDIRYLGIEFGPNSYHPTDPVTVLQRRFGDCKDKAFLLSTLLRGLGYDAAPVLVATGFRHTLPDLLPAPHAFDHVIVRVIINGTTCWLDPTRTYQRGPISQRYSPAYSYGLLVRPGETGLISIPFSSEGAPETLTTEVFRVGGQKDPSQLDVTSIYKGFDAEWMRAYLSAEGRERLAKSILNDYAQRYPGITISAPPVVEDSPNSDTLTFKNTYSITNFWTLSADKQRYNCQFYPLGIRSWITKPATAIRSLPMELSFPRRRVVRTQIKLPEDFAISNSTNSIVGPAAELCIKRTYHGQTVWLDYEYKSLTNFVPVSRTAEHLGSLDRMEDALGYSLLWQNMDGVGKGSPFNWPVFMLAAIYATMLAMGLGILCWRQSRRALAAAKPPLLDGHLNGIGGWLVLVTIGLVCGPIRLLVSLGGSLGAYSLLNWQALTTPGGVSYHPAWGPMLTFELWGQLTILILNLFVVALFFRKHPIFPRWYIAFLLVNVVYTAADCFGVRILRLSSSVVAPELLKSLVQSIAACCIWIPYMCVSRRVQATFGRSRESEERPVSGNFDQPKPHHVEPVLKNIVRPEPHHYHGRAHMICFWLCLLALPLVFLEMNVKNAWTTGVSIAVFVMSVVFAIVAIVKQSNSDMPRTLKCLPFLLPAVAVLGLCCALIYGIALGVIEGKGRNKTPPVSTTPKASVADVAIPTFSTCLGFAGLVLLIRYQGASKESPFAAPSQNE